MDLMFLDFWKRKLILFSQIIYLCSKTNYACKRENYSVVFFDLTLDNSREHQSHDEIPRFHQIHFCASWAPGFNSAERWLFVTLRTNVDIRKSRIDPPRANCECYECSLHVNSRQVFCSCIAYLLILLHVSLTSFSAHTSIIRISKRSSTPLCVTFLFFEVLSQILFLISEELCLDRICLAHSVCAIRCDTLWNA